MESGSYKEFDAKNARSVRFFAFLITTVTIVLCLLVGIGCWILIAGNSSQAIPVNAAKNVVEEIVIVEEVQPEQVVPTEIDFKEGKANDLDTQILEEVKESIQQEIEEETPIIPQFPVNEHPFIQTLVDISNTFASDIFSKLAESENLSKMFGFEDDEESSEVHSRQRRSVMGFLGNPALKYLSYLSFGRFMYNEVYSITEYNVEGRKLAGDYDAFFLDNGFWPNTDSKKKTEKKSEAKADEKADTEQNAIQVAKPTRLTTAFDDGWTPMVNKVSLKFITDMLTTLLNLMREYLMRDNVMECLWFMFCKDMNHQANYNDPMGYLARVNSVGLKVLTDKEGRETDTIRSVWEALTAWKPLNCDVMFPKCDGSKALEIVNEVANASRK